jgi:hypothetical protein
MRKQLVAAGVAAVSAMQAAHAALPTEVTTAIDTYEADGLTAAGLILGAGVVIWGIVKIGRKFGWF